MNINKTVPEKKTVEASSIQKQSFSVALPEDTGRCMGCPYPGVGFICWSKDGSCMKTDVEKISSRSRR